MSAEEEAEEEAEDATAAESPSPETTVERRASFLDGVTAAAVAALSRVSLATPPLFMPPAEFTTADDPPNSLSDGEESGSDHPDDTGELRQPPLSAAVSPPSAMAWPGPRGRESVTFTNEFGQ